MAKTEVCRSDSAVASKKSISRENYAKIDGTLKTRLELGFSIWVVQTLNARVGPTRKLPFTPTWSLVSHQQLVVREVPLKLPPASHLFRSEDTRAIKLAAGVERILDDGHPLS